MIISRDLPKILKQNKKIIIPIVIVVAIGLAFFLGPKISSYATYSDRIGELEDELDTSKTTIADLTGRVSSLESDLSGAQDSVSEKNMEISRLTRELEDAEQEYQEEIDQLEEDYNTATEKFDIVIENSAKNICCKMKFDNPNIDSFKLEDDKIVCTTGGTFALSCSLPV